MNTPSVSADRFEPTPRFDVDDGTSKKIDQSNGLDLSYEALTKRNIAIRDKNKTDSPHTKDDVLNTLKTERVRSVMVCFTDAEGRLHQIAFSVDSIVNAWDNLNFDGSSIPGFTAQLKSDLGLSLDPQSFRFLPGDVFGPGQVMLFASIKNNKDGTPYEGDARARLNEDLKKIRAEQGWTVNTAFEIEGMVVEGVDAEQHFDENVGLTPASMTQYMDGLPGTLLPKFIQRLTEALGALGFKPERSHTEVAGGQFESNYSYADALTAADQFVIYQFVARIIANQMGVTASFLPKSVAGVNGAGAHTNLSVADKAGKNLFYDAEDPIQLSRIGRQFVTGVLEHGQEIALGAFIASASGGRRLDPHYEAPNALQASAQDRGSMVRKPDGNEKTARVEVRSVAPDVNPYLALQLLIRAGARAVLDNAEPATFEIPADPKKLPATLHDAIDPFANSSWVQEVMGAENQVKYVELKREAAERLPRALGRKIKKDEVRNHHSVRHQGTKADF